MGNKTVNKRLGIWWFGGDRTGVHDSDVVFIESLMPYLDRLMVICSSALSVDDRAVFSRWSHDVIIMDASYCTGAYAKALDSVTDKETMQYDEVLFFDRRLIGPFYPLDAMFDTMNNRTCDYWGLHWCYRHRVNAIEKARLNKPWKAILPDYIPWSFFAVRKSLLKSKSFKQLMNRALRLSDAVRSEYQIEMKAAQQFTKAGFTSSDYLDTELFRDYAYNSVLTAPYRTLKALKSPYLYAKLFHMNMSETLEYTLGQTIVDTLMFIKKETKYDMDVLYDHVLKSGHQHDIKNAFGLTFSLPSGHDIPAKDIGDMQVALCMHLYYEDLFDECLAYAASMPVYADLYITTNTEEKKKLLEQKIAGFKCAKCDVRVIGNRGRDVSALLVGCRDVMRRYDLICFAHDKKTTQHSPNCIGETFAYQCFENILKTPHYVSNLIQTFIQNPRLGILSPTPPFHAELYNSIGREWERNFKRTKELADQLDIQVPLSEDKPPLAPLGTMFWFRGQALEMLCDDNMTYTDFPEEPNDVDGTILHAYERLYPYAAQQSGYFAGHCMVDTYAQIQTNAYYHMLWEFNHTCFKQIDLKYDNYNKLMSQVKKKVKKNLYLRLEHFVLSHFNEGIIRFLKVVLRKQKK